MYRSVPGLEHAKIVRNAYAIERFVSKLLRHFRKINRPFINPGRRPRFKTVDFYIDALGGEMGKNIDKTFIQSKMLNKSKGPAVHSLRAQADKASYTMEMRKTLTISPVRHLAFK